VLTQKEKRSTFFALHWASFVFTCYLLHVTSVRTTDTEWQLNCSK